MNAPQATAHSSRPAPAPDPRPVIKGTALPRAPEPRQCEWLITGFAEWRELLEPYGVG